MFETQNNHLIGKKNYDEPIPNVMLKTPESCNKENKNMINIKMSKLRITPDSESPKNMQKELKMAISGQN